MFRNGIGLMKLFVYLSYQIRILRVTNQVIDYYLVYTLISSLKILDIFKMIPTKLIWLLLQTTLWTAFAQTFLSTFIPYQIELLSQYDTASETVRNIIIEPVYDSSIKTQIFFPDFKNRFEIAAFYFFKVLYVRKITIQSQTLFPSSTCDSYQIPKSYQEQGFNPQFRDFVVFVKKSTDQQQKAIACAVERRPLYGILTMTVDSELLLKNYHERIYSLVHSLIHLLGFYSVYFIQNPLATPLQLSQQIDQSQTFFFVNSSSTERLKRNSVIRQNPVLRRNDTFLIITPQVKTFVKSYFNCDSQDIGAILQKKVTNVIYPDLNDNDFLYSHWDSETFNNQLMSVWKYIYQQMRITTLSLAFLQDTGFYEFVNTDFAQNHPYQYQFDGCSFLLKNHTSNMCQYLKGRNQCSPTQSVLEFGQQCQQLSQAYQQSSCLEQGTKFKCFSSVSSSTSNQTDIECLQTQCLNDGSLIIEINSRILNFCKEGQTQFFIPDSGISYNCPANMHAFCRNNLCQNWCNQKGLCINGRCMYPDGSLDRRFNQYTGVPSYVGYCQNAGKWYNCPIGCINCTCYFPSDSQIMFYECYQVLKGVFDTRGLPNSDFTPKQCIDGCQQCFYIDQKRPWSSQNNKCRSCRANYFSFQFDQKKLAFCYECDSNCASCISIFQCRSQCIDCRQGYYLSADGKCQDCEVQNCLTCNSQQQCISCVDGYFLSQQKDACLECQTNCGTCGLKISNCIDCRPGFYMKEQQCFPCADNCRICTSNTECLTCFDGYLFNSNYQCTKRCEVPCLTCSSENNNYCISCLDGYILNTSTNTCDPSVNCSELEGDARCQFCPFQYTTGKQTTQEQGKCSKVSTQNCAYESSGLCISCLKGYYKVDSSYQSCSECPLGCSACAYKYCYECQSGYAHPRSMDGTPIKFQCAPCTHNCLTCSSAPNQCLTCKDGYTKIGWKCVGSSFVNYTILFSSASYDQFIQNQDYRTIVQQILSNLSSLNIQSHTILSITAGSVKFSGLLSKVESTEDSSSIALRSSKRLTRSNSRNLGTITDGDCYIYDAALEYLTTASQISKYTISSVEVTSSNQLCLITETTVSAQNYLTTVIIVAVACTIMLLIIVFMCIIYIRVKNKMQMVILKYQQIASKPQYSSTTTIQKEAF